MRSNGVGTRCLHRTLQEHLEEPELLDFSLLRHITDSGITAELLHRHRRPPREFKRVKQLCLNRLAQEFTLAGGVCHRVSGSRRFLESLQELDGVSYGIVAHNWEVTARAKLMQAEHNMAGFPFASADDGHSRTQILMACHDRVAEVEAREEFERVTFIGSGSVDAAAALALGWRFVGVGSEVGTPAMRLAGGDLLFKDYKEHSSVLDALLRN